MKERSKHILSILGATAVLLAIVAIINSAPVHATFVQPVLGVSALLAFFLIAYSVDKILSDHRG